MIKSHVLYRLSYGLEGLSRAVNHSWPRRPGQAPGWEARG